MPTATPAHFNVDVTFGSPTFARAVKPVHFSADVQFRGPAVYSISATRPWVFLIAGTDRTTSVHQGEENCTVNLKLGAISSCQFTTVSEDATYRPTRGQEFVLIESATGDRIFGGFIQSIEEISPAGTACIKDRCTAVGYAQKLEERRVGAYFQYPTIIYSTLTMMNEILRDYIPEAGIVISSQGSGGSVITTDVVFQWVTGMQAARQLADPEGLEVYVDEYGRLAFIDPATGLSAAPFNISDGDGNVDASDGIGPRVRRDATRYANVVIVRPDLRQPGMWTDTWAGDEGPGASVGFYITKYRLDVKPNVYVNGTLQTVGEYASSAGSVDFTYVPNGHGVQASPGTTYGSSDVIEIKYPVPLQPVYMSPLKENIATDPEVVSFGRIVEILYDIADVYEPDLLQAIANGLREKHKRQPYTIEYQTIQSGLKPGMLQTVNLTKPLLPNLSLLIDSVSATFQPTVEGGHFLWKITATNGAPQGEKDLPRMIRRIRERLAQPLDRHREIFRWDLALTVDGMTNPGQHPHANSEPPFDTSPLVLRRTHVVSRDGYIGKCKIRYDSPPLTNTIQIDVKKNGVSILPALGSPAAQEYLEVPPSTDSPVVAVSYEYFRFNETPLRVVPGDVLAAEVITGDEDAMDGVLEVEQQG